MVLFTAQEVCLIKNNDANPQSLVRVVQFLLLGRSVGGAGMHTPYLKSLNNLFDWQYSIGIVVALWLYLRSFPKGAASLWVCNIFGAIAGPGSYFIAYWAGPLVLRWFSKVLAMMIPSVPDLSFLRYDLSGFIGFAVAYSIIGTLSTLLTTMLFFRAYLRRRSKAG
jgi:hypothetical protein